MQVVKAGLQTALNSSIGSTWWKGSGRRSAINAIINDFEPFFHAPDSRMYHVHVRNTHTRAHAFMLARHVLPLNCVLGVLVTRHLAWGTCVVACMRIPQRLDVKTASKHTLICVCACALQSQPYNGSGAPRRCSSCCFPLDSLSAFSLVRAACPVAPAAVLLYCYSDPE